MAVVPHINEEHGPELTITQARQGNRGRHMAWVLGLSLALVVVGFVALYLYHLPHLSTPGSESQVTSQQQLQGTTAFNAPPSQPRQSENPQTTPTITPGVGSNGKGL